jgi:predicted dinucleotide-binding enzyme
MKVGIVGKGNVGSAIGAGLEKAGHEVKYGHRDPNENVKAAAEWGEAIILAIPYSAVKDVVKEISPLVKGKMLIDCTNPIGTDGRLEVGRDDSAGEQIQKLLPEAKVVKGFNYVFPSNMSKGTIGKDSLTMFLAGDDVEAKRTAMKLVEDLGFEPVDAGALTSSRYLEPMAMLIVTLAYDMKMGTKVGFKLVKG